MILTPSALKNRFLPGVPLTDQYGRPYPDEHIEQVIQSTIATFQRLFAVRLQERIIKLGQDPIKGDPDPTSLGLPLEVRDPQDWDPNTFEENRQAFLRLPVGPVKEVYGMALKLPGQMLLYQWPKDWIKTRYRRKVVRIYPGTTMTFTPTAQSGIAIYAITSGRIIPASVHVTFRAGYNQDDLEGDDADVLACVGKMAAIELLTPGSLDRNFVMGVSGLSVSVDGLSNSTNLLQNSQGLKYQNLIMQYTNEIQTWSKMYKKRLSGVKMGWM